MNINTVINTLKRLDKEVAERKRLADEIGSYLKGIRQHVRVSLGYMSKLSGLSVSYHSQVENGHKRPSLKMLEAYRILEARDEDCRLYPNYTMIYAGGES